MHKFTIPACTNTNSWFAKCTKTTCMYMNSWVHSFKMLACIKILWICEFHEFIRTQNQFVHFMNWRASQSYCEFVNFTNSSVHFMNSRKLINCELYWLLYWLIVNSLGDQIPMFMGRSLLKLNRDQRRHSKYFDSEKNIRKYKYSFDYSNAIHSSVFQTVFVNHKIAKINIRSNLSI